MKQIYPVWDSRPKAPKIKTSASRSIVTQHLTGPRDGLGLYNDPLWEYIPTTPSLREALDLPTMQRLRRLKQLATLDLIFAGATHTRFEHSVGVFYLAEKAFDTLLNKSKQFVSSQESQFPSLTLGKKLALQYAALFHDVGHGPFSHIWDIFCQRNHNDDYINLRHDRLTWRLIAEGIGPYQDIPEFLIREAEHFARMGVEDADLLRPENIAAIATGAPPPSDPSSLFLSQIVSSWFDVDRLDYLPRDALHTGVRVGTTDVWQILNAYTLYFEPKQKVWQLAIDIDASEAVEFFLKARDQAYRRIYYHKMNRIAVEMMTAALLDLVQLHDPEQLALLTDDELLGVFVSEGTPFTRDVANRIQSRRVYEPLPYDVEGFRDLDFRARQVWKEYFLRGQYTDLMASLKELGERIGLYEHERILFDLSQIPLAMQQDFTTPYLLDIATGTVHSLMEVLPHLQLIYGAVEFAGEHINIGERYIDMISRLLIAIPLEFLLRGLADVLNCELLPHNESAESSQQKYSDEVIERVVELTYVNRLQPILTHFIRFLDFREEIFIQKLQYHFRTKSYELLRKLFNKYIFPSTAASGRSTSLLDEMSGYSGDSNSCVMREK